MYDYHDLCDANEMLGAAGEDAGQCVRLMEAVLRRWLAEAEVAPPLHALVGLAGGRWG
jgi:hypothetical protein